ncbi:MAG: hypothetical protein AAGC86_00915 [Pseudomonadota bacterium]
MNEQHLKINQLDEDRSRRMRLASLGVKIVLIAVGSFIAGAAAFFSAEASWPLTLAQFAGLVGLMLALLGSAFVVFTEQDASEALVEARQAIGQADVSKLKALQTEDELLAYRDAVTRLTSLYYALTSARGTIEQSLTHERVEELKLVQACLEISRRDLCIALGFDLRYIWTIGVYKAVPSENDGSTELELVAHDRSVECEIKNARRWREGIGVGGIAYAKNGEVVVPDLDDPAVGTAFKLSPRQIKDEDRDRYKSLFAVPIQVGGDVRPWGVALATCNVPDYFGNTEIEGVEPEEAVRTLAGIVALAVSACRVRDLESSVVSNQGDENGSHSAPA